MTYQKLSRFFFTCTFCALLLLIFFTVAQIVSAFDDSERVYIAQGPLPLPLPGSPPVPNPVNNAAPTTNQPPAPANNPGNSGQAAQNNSNAGIAGTNPLSFSNPLAADSIQEFIADIIDAIVLIAFPFLVLFLVYSGFLFVRAQGNASKLQEARKIFIWTLIGALLVLGAQALSIAIKNTVDELRREAGITYNATHGNKA